MSENTTSAMPRTDPMPYYTLRGFLDAEYGVIITLAFVKFVELAAGILKTVISEKFLDKMEAGRFGEGLSIIGSTVKYGPFGDFNVNFMQAIGSFILMFICFIMLVDDYYQARVLSFWAPCRTIRRFAMDVAIGFTFGATLLAAYVQSYLAGLFLCLSYLIGSKWGKQVYIETREWEKEQIAGNPGAHGQFGAKTNNWRLFRSRLDFINKSHEIIAAALVLVSVVFGYLEHKFQIANLYFFFALTAILITWLAIDYFMRFERELIETIRNEISCDSGLTASQKEVAAKQVVVLDSMLWLVLAWLPRRIRNEFGRRFGGR